MTATARPQAVEAEKQAAQRMCAPEPRQEGGPALRLLALGAAGNRAVAMAVQRAVWSLSVIG